MPTYEYECNKCGEHLEMFQKMTDEPLRICPKCAGILRRVVSGGTGFISRSTVSSKEVATRCGIGSPCCGADEPCESPPCR